MLKNSIFFISLLLLIITSSSCVYRQDIHQGNRIDQDKLAQLKLGMTQKQVRFLLGQAAISDPYHKDTWVYIYFLKNSDQQAIEQRVMNLQFSDNLLIKIDGSLEETTTSSDNST